MVRNASVLLLWATRAERSGSSLPGLAGEAMRAEMVARARAAAEEHGMPAIVLDQFSGAPLAWWGCGEGAAAAEDPIDLDRVRERVVAATGSGPRNDMAMAARSPE